MIAEHIATVKEQIAAAEKKSGRPAGSARLIAVSKTVAAESVRAALDAGITDLGENRVQEARDKIAVLGRHPPRWHLIGHLQRNKVKYVFGLFDLIHSVDSAELAAEIHNGATRRGACMPVLAQVNIGADAAKSGVEPKRLPELLAALAALDGLRVEGLMAILPYDPNPEASRRHYAALRELRDRMEKLRIGGIALRELSMGMSNDFTVAIEEGATLVRVGTAIFGAREHH